VSGQRTDIARVRPTSQTPKRVLLTLIDSIYHPTSGPPLSSGPATVLLLLPRGPLLSNPDNDVANAFHLRSRLPFTIAQVNYRLGSAHPYPTPVHDVLAGYDWVQEHLLPKRSITRAGRSEHVGRVCVVGELLGGSLATMLAVTECRKGEPGVVAAAINNPLADWVQPDDELELTSPKSSLAKFGQKHAGLEIDDLLRARGNYFLKPETYFDPFASPLLFFRTPGTTIPLDRRSEVDDLDLLSAIEREDFHRQQMLLSGMSNVSLQEIASGVAPGIEELRPSMRKASRLFPNKNLKLELPSFYFSTGNTSPLSDQAQELSHTLRKSVIRQYRAAFSNRSGFGHKMLMDHEAEQMDEEQRLEKKAEEAEADEKVSMNWSEGLGLWDQTAGGRRALENATTWLREKLR
jgi:acetyl esterase/lipase